MAAASEDAQALVPSSVASTSAQEMGCKLIGGPSRARGSPSGCADMVHLRTCSPRNNARNDEFGLPHRPLRPPPMPPRFHHAITTLPLRLFLRLARARSLSVDALLRDTPLDPTFVDDVRQKVELSQCNAVAAACLKESQDPSFGVRAGLAVTLGDLDLPGLYLRMQDDHAAAADFHREHRDVFEAAGIASIRVLRETVKISLLDAANVKAHPVLADCLVTAAVMLSKAIIGPFEPRLVELERPRPRDDTLYRHVFGPDLAFERATSSFQVPRGIMAGPMPFRDSSARAVLAPHVMRQVQAIREARADLVTRTAQAIRETIADDVLSADGVARRLGLSTRSLRRALQQAGTSYMRLVDRERSELARKYAQQKPSMSGNDIADRLGYKNLPAFYRAFQRWTGMTLSAYREHSPSAKVP